MDDITTPQKRLLLRAVRVLAKLKWEWEGVIVLVQYSLWAERKSGSVAIISWRTDSHWSKLSAPNAAITWERNTWVNYLLLGSICIFFPWRGSSAINWLQSIYNLVNSLIILIIIDLFLGSPSHQQTSAGSRWVVWADFVRYSHIHTHI